MKFAALVVAATFTATVFADPPIRLHPGNPHYLLFRGKPTILIGSTEHYGAVLNLEFEYKTYLDELQSKGLNLTRTFSGTYREIAGTFNITDNTLGPSEYICPWKRSDQPGASDGGKKFDLKAWDDAYFARLKDFVSEAGKRGVVVEYVLFCTLYNDALWKANPLNAANNVNDVGNCGRREVFTLQHPEITAIQDAFVRKTVGELNAFDNVYFEICNEPYFENVTDAWQAHIAQTIVDAEKELPNKHLIAQNIANDHKKVEKPNPLVSILNFHYATPPVTVDENYASKRVIADDETGFRGKLDATYLTEGWDFIVAGGAIYDNLDYSFTPPHPGGDFLDYKSPGGGSAKLRQSLGALRRFMEGFDFVNMAPHNEIIKGGSITASLNAANPASTGAVTVRVLAQVGKAYAIYVRGGTGAELRLDLPGGKYKLEWISPVDGSVMSASELDQAAGGEALLRSPAYSGDIAIKLIKN
jgi:hypothetical protein